MLPKNDPQERATKKRPEWGMQALPNWAWQMHGRAPLPLLSSAASSGFSTASVAATAQPPYLQPSSLSPPVATHHHLLFPPGPLQLQAKVSMYTYGGNDN